jgi:ribosomal protein S18 acetylase RimI-like enzyme
MINAVLDIKLLDPDEWHVLRTTRLRALEDSPHAFASHFDAEASWSDEQWQQRAAAAAWLVAVDSGEVIGIAGLVDEHVEAIWVEPTHRQRGVFRALLRALVDLESGNGARDLVLWVLESNRDAREVYQRLGFVPTRERQRLSDGRYELRLRLRIRPRS